MLMIRRLLVVVWIILALAPLGPAHGQEWVATTAQELIDFIQRANATPGPDKIYVVGDIAVSKIFARTDDRVGNAFPAITTPITIQSRYWGTNSNDYRTISRAGDERMRFFSITPTGRLTLIGMTLRGGNVTQHVEGTDSYDWRCDGGTIGCGGAIRNDGGTLVTIYSGFDSNQADHGGAIEGEGRFFLSSTIFNHNIASFQGGAMSLIGGIIKISRSSFNLNEAGYSGGAAILYRGATVVNTSFSFNSAGNGGGLYLGGEGTNTVTACWFQENTASSAGALFSDATMLRVIGSVFLKNEAAMGGAIATNKPLFIFASAFIDQRAQGGGAIYQSFNTLEVHQSTFARNQAYYGGALYLSDPHATITNSTFSVNQASYGGGVMFISSYVQDQTEFAIDGVLMTNVTMFGNSAGAGAVTYTDAKRTTSMVMLRNSLLIDNGPTPACIGPVDNFGGNLLSGGGCGDLPITTDPLVVLPLAPNGGLTDTHALVIGSPAINGGLAGFCPATDQRGVMRDGCDVGAFEWTESATVPN